MRQQVAHWSRGLVGDALMQVQHLPGVRRLQQQLQAQAGQRVPGVCPGPPHPRVLLPCPPPRRALSPPPQQHNVQRYCTAGGGSRPPTPLPPRPPRRPASRLKCFYHLGATDGTSACSASGCWCSTRLMRACFNAVVGWVSVCALQVYLASL